MYIFAGDVATADCWESDQTYPQQKSTHGKSLRRRIYLEEKAQFVTSVWGTEFFQFLAALATVF